MLKRLLRALAPVLVLAALPAVSPAAVFIGVSVNLAPPPLPVYVQPALPGPGYIWVPGYWAWNDGAYYWVPGTWVLPPGFGLLWTPGYWGWNEGAYVWNAGYWGPRVGFYGGVDYGFGYDGDGFDGGYWRGRAFYYNRAVTQIGPRYVTNVYYQRPVYVHNQYEHVSFNGGPRGVPARPTRLDLMAARERRAAFVPAQRQQERLAFADRSLRADVNHGRPPIAATQRAAMFRGPGVIRARAAGGRVSFRNERAPTTMRRQPYRAPQRSQSRQPRQYRSRPGQPPPQRFRGAARPPGQPQYRGRVRPGGPGGARPYAERSRAMPPRGRAPQRQRRAPPKRPPPKRPPSRR